ncbi:MAG: hypothetical protein EOL97_08320 [Spirochaetia bacterium]|nr:hypothetical protein [Spirochaetia bacterium]
MDNNKRNIYLAILGIVIIVAIILRFDNFLKQRQEKKNLANNQQEEVLDLKEENNEVVKAALNYKNSEKEDISKEDIYIGNFNSKVNIIIYEDYSDKISAGYNEVLNKAIEEFSLDNITIAFRPYYIDKRGVTPELSNILWCANDQGKFIDLRSEVYKKVEQDDFLVSDVFDLAEEIGLDKEELTECVNMGKYRERVDYLANNACDYGVFGSPTTFVNEELVIGSRGWEDQIDSNNEMVSGLKTIISRNLE